MAKRPNDRMSAAEQKQIREYLSRLPKPVPTKATPEFRKYFDETVVPVLKDQALSELRRTDQFSPRLISFMDDGSMGIVDIGAAMGGNFGSAQSKEITARVHQFSAKVPGVNVVVFCCETWMLHSTKEQPIPEEVMKKSIADHPDRKEAVMFNALHFDPKTGAMYQLIAMFEVLKVLGADRSFMAWQGTVYADATMVSDPMGEPGQPAMKGRFIVGDPDNDT